MGSLQFGRKHHVRLMARLLTMGFELGLTTYTWPVEADNTFGSDGGSLSLVEGRRGGSALRLQSFYYYASPLDNGYGGRTVLRQFLSSPTYSKFYVRVYIRFTTLPGDTMIFCILGASTGGSQTAYCRLNTDGTVTFGADSPGGGDITTTKVLSTTTWYKFELLADIENALDTTVRLKIDGADQGAVNGSFTNGINRLSLLATSLVAPITMDFDDIAINDSTGSHQNTYPPEAQIIALSPGSAGELSQWTSSSGSALADIDELPPLLTDYLSSPGNNQKFFFTVQKPRAGARVHMVEVGCQFSGTAGSGNARFVLTAQTANGGSVASSANILPTNTTVLVNALAVPYNSPLVMYTDPSGTPWTPATLKSLQIGAATTNLVVNNDSRIYAIWALAEVSNFELSNIASVSGLNSVTGT